MARKRIASATIVVVAAVVFATNLCYEAHAFVAARSAAASGGFSSANIGYGAADTPARDGRHQRSAVVPVASVAFAVALMLNSARSGKSVARRNSVARASVSEDLIEAIQTYGSNDADDMYEVRKVLKKLPACGQSAFGKLPGTWKTLWTSKNGRKGCVPTSKRTAPLNFECKKLPAKSVDITSVFDRVTDSEYQQISAFTVGGVEAAFVLTSKWSQGSSEGNWGKGAERVRVGITFETVQMVPSAADPDASTAMLKSEGFGDFLEPTSYAGAANYIDLKSMVGSLRLHQTEAGVQHLMERIEDDGIPFVLA